MHITGQELALASLGVAAISVVAGSANVRSANRNQRRLAHLERISDRQIDTYVELLRWAKGTQEAVHREPGMLDLIEALMLPDDLELRSEAFASDVVRQRVREFQDAWYKAHRKATADRGRLWGVVAEGSDFQAGLQALRAAFPEYEAASESSERIRDAVRTELIGENVPRQSLLRAKRDHRRPDPL